MNKSLHIFRFWIGFFGILFLSCGNSSIPPTGNNTVSLLTGRWVVVGQTISPIMIIPNCKPIQNGSTFHFKEDSLEVYVDASKKPCDVFTFKISGNTISLIKTDMIWLCTYELNQDSFKLSSDHFFTHYESDKSIPANSQPPTTQRVVLTFKKKNN